MQKFFQRRRPIANPPMAEHVIDCCHWSVWIGQPALLGELIIVSLLARYSILSVLSVRPFPLLLIHC
ncbi:Atrochrysone carboxylic acid synthase [Trichinella pseudospiralis]